MWIIAQVGDEIAPADVEHRAEGNESTGAHVFPQAPVEDGGAQRATLAEEAHVAGSGHGAGEGGVEPRQRAHHTEAVRPNDAHLPAARLLQDLPLEPSSLFADLLKPCRDDDGALHPCCGAFAYYVRHSRRGRSDHCKIDRPW